MLGPLAAGLFSDYLSWRWIFFVNLPLGALAIVTLLRRFPERVERRRQPLDVAGAVLLTTGCGALIFGLLEGGSAWPWRSGPSYAVLGLALVSLALLVVVERRAADPVLPLWVLRRRVLVSGNLAALGVGALHIGLSTYVPTWVQGVLGTGAVEAGLALGALTIGWPIAASLSGRLYLRIGFRDTALIGVVLAVTGAVLAARLTAEAQTWHVAGAMFVIGLGLGLSSSPVVAPCSPSWAGSGGASSPAPTCSPGPSAPRWVPLPSARWPTRRSPAAFRRPRRAAGEPAGRRRRHDAGAAGDRSCRRLRP